MNPLDQTISTTTQLSTEERRKLLETWNQTASTYNRASTIHESVSAQARRTPQKTAVTFEGQSLTYAELEQRSNQFAHHLQHLGVGPETLVGLYLTRSLEMVVGLLGILKAGGAYIPIDPDFPTARIRLMLEDAQPGVLVTQEALLANLGGSFNTICVDSDRQEIIARPTDSPVSGITSSNLAYIIYTSGSTGRPKGVQIEHRSVVNFLTAMAHEPGITSDDHLLALTTLSFDISALEIFLPLISGARLTVVSRELAMDGLLLGRMIEEANITLLQATPATWRLLLAAGWDGKADLKVLCGGEVLPQDLAQALLPRCASLWNMYGPTETTVWSTTCRIISPTEQITIGRPIANTQIYLLDKTLQPVTSGSVGDLYIAGDGVARGYYNRPELTSGRFLPNPFQEDYAPSSPTIYHTGDLARYQEDGRLIFLGREDQQVKIRGFRIELEDIDATVAQHPAVATNMTIAREDVPGDKRLVSYVIAEPGQKAPATAELRQFLRRLLPDYMLPAHVVPLEEFPLTPNNKINRLALPTPGISGEETGQPYVAPRSQLQSELVDLAAEILHQEEMGVEDNFFDLGGNSLLAMRLISQVRDVYKATVPVRAFFSQPTVAGLSQTITTARDSGALEIDLLDDAAASDQELGDGEHEDSELLAKSNLTRSQFLMWMGQRMNDDAPLYNVIETFAIRGVLDVSAFRRAFQILVDQSDILRTVIEEVDGVPRQVVVENVDASVALIDFSGEPDPDAAARTWISHRKTQPLPFDQPLFDTALLKLADDYTVWYLGQHHIITDALSEDLIFKRVAHFYELALQNRLQEAKPPPQYVEHIQYEHQIRQTAGYRRAAAFWREQSNKPIAKTQFYGSSARGDSLQTRRVTVDLGAERSTRLREIAARSQFAPSGSDLSLFTIFATLLFTTLHRLNGERSVRIGTPFHGRPTADSLEIIGLFIEMGLLTIDVEEGETFTSLADKVMTETLAGLAHVLPGISSANTNRAYDVILNFLQPTFTNFAGMPVSYEWVHSGAMDKDQSLRLQVTDFEGSGNFSLAFDMKTAVFGETESAWLVEKFLRVVDVFILDTSRPIGGFSLLSGAGQQRMLEKFNDTAAPYPRDKTVVHLFEDQVKRAPGSIAVEEGEASVTYAGLNARANQLAHYLREQGVGPETAVAICMNRSVEVLVAIWGVLKAGGAYVPIDPVYPQERITFMIDDAAPRIVLTAGDTILPELETAKNISTSDLDLAAYSTQNPEPTAGSDNLVYMIYTSGSTGKPKGTMITHRGLLNYAWWARSTYQDEGEVLDFPLYSSLAFDLTVTSIFVPLLSGGKVVVYGESLEMPGLEILSVFAENRVDIVKLTPAHLGLVRELSLSNPRIRKLIVGGEDFKTDLARDIDDLFDGQVAIYNEYGPTEATVACMVHEYDRGQDTAVSVPIGSPAANARIYLLDQYDQPVPPGVVGEMIISSDGVARGYHQRPLLTAERFGEDPSRPGARIYRSGDIARWDENGRMVFLGRRDHQVKISGARIELGEIEARLLAHEAVQDVVVNVLQVEPRLEEQAIVHCARCGLPSNYPDVSFNGNGFCSLCTDFDAFRDDVFHYFKTRDDLQAIVAKAKAGRGGEYDCMMLYSGGKDSTYVLCQLVEMGLKVLAFSLDNGYISEEAKENVRRITSHLGVDLHFATTPHMNAIFADSLERYSNVCQGCYKVIYTLSMKLAREKGINFIFTGLSQGQLFETRLDELFRYRIFDVAQMDEAILQARKVYHRMDDAVQRLLDVSMFADDRVFGEIQFVDFFRYSDVELEEIYEYLSTRVSWIRPADTGRSTNCLINEAGIFVHQTERGYHNYALPYSWDVRLGHKTREEAMEELDDDLRLPMVRQMLDEVGYTVKSWHADQSQRRLAAYYVSDNETLTVADLRANLAERLPAYMIPAYFVRLETLPLTPNGKVNRHNLPDPAEKRPEIDAAYVAPRSDLEIQLAAFWSQTIHVDRVGIYDNFFDLGGASIPAIQVVAKISDAYQVDFPVSSFFEHPTIAGQSAVLEEVLVAQLEAMSDEEVATLLAELDE